MIRQRGGKKMNMKQKLIAAILSLSLAVAPFSGVQAKEAKVAEKAIPTVQEIVDSTASTIMDNGVQAKALSSDVTEPDAPVDTPVQKKIHMYNLDGKTVSYMAPYYYTKRSQLEGGKYNAYTAVIPGNYDKEVILPVKVKAKGALALAAASEAGNELSAYVYSDSACKKMCSVSDDLYYLPKATTYYIKVYTYSLEQDVDNMIAVVLGFVSGANAELKNKSNVISASFGSNSPIYYKMVISKTSKVTVRFDAKYSTYVTLCNSKKSAITHEEYVYSSVGRAVYVVPKGTYYLKVKKSKEAFSVASVFTPVSNAAPSSKSKAGTLKVNGSTRNILVCPADSTGRTYYMKFYNPKRQKITLNVTSSFTSGKIEFQFLDSKNSSFGTRTIYNGINKKNVYTPYTYTTGSSQKTLPKGTYYIKFKKLDKKSSGIIQVNVKNK